MAARKARGTWGAGGADPAAHKRGTWGADGADPAARLLLGLGNPGPRYSGTRHNMGFDWIDRLAERWGTRLSPWKGLGELGRAERPEGAVLLAKPATYMNLSGRMLAELMRRRGVKPEEALVAYDDMALPLGRLRLRLKGSAGGHNGMRSVLETAGTDRVPRIRMGVGPVPDGMDPAKFVLARFRPDERETREALLERAVEAAEAAVEDGFSQAMNRYNPQ